VKCRSLFKEETGSALIEFLGFGLLLQVSVLIGVVQLSNFQAQQMAVESIARHALRSYVLFGTAPEDTGEQLLADLGTQGKLIFALACSPDCDAQGSVIRLKVMLGSATSTAVSVK
jgi:hypothetical protein